MFNLQELAQAASLTHPHNPHVVPAGFDSYIDDSGILQLRARNLRSLRALGLEALQISDPISILAAQLNDLEIHRAEDRAQISRLQADSLLLKAENEARKKEYETLIAENELRKKECDILNVENEILQVRLQAVEAYGEVIDRGQPGALREFITTGMGEKLWARTAHRLRERGVANTTISYIKDELFTSKAFLNGDVHFGTMTI